MIFKGSTEKCLKHFSQTYQTNRTGKEVHKIRNVVCQLFGVNQQTARVWFNGYQVPIGENLLRIRLFLALNDYEVSERQELSVIVREFADQVALGVLSVNEAVKYLDATRDAVMRILTTQRKATGERESKIAELVQFHREEAEQKEKGWATAIQSLDLYKPAEKTLMPAPRMSASHKDDSMTIDTLAHLIKACLPLAERLLSDEFSADDRRKLRELTANGRSNAVFDLSNALNRLCGERARKEIS